MSNYAKGQELERWVANYFMRKGEWIVYYKAPHVRFSKSHDIFNMWDIVAIDRDLHVSVYVQVKKNISDYYSFKKIAKEWLAKMKLNKVNCCELFYVIWTDKKKMRIWDCLAERELIAKVEK